MNVRPATTVDEVVDAAIEVDTEFVREAQFRDIKPFLLGVYANITHPENSYFEIILGLVGFAIGAISTYASYPLAAYAIQEICALFLITGLPADILEVVFGILAFALTGIMLALPSQDEFIKFSRYLAGAPIIPTRNDRPKQRMLARGIAEAAALLTGLPFVGLLYGYLEDVPVLNYFIPITALISSYTVCIFVEKGLLADYFNYTALPNAIRDELIKDFDNAIININKKDALALCVFHRSLRAPEIITTKEQQVLFILKQIFNEEDNSTVVITENSKSGLYRVLSISAFLMGAISVGVYYLPAQVFLQQFMLLGLAIALSILSTAANMSFDAMYAKYGVDFIWEEIRTQGYISKQTFFGLMSSILASFPTLALAFIETDNNPIEMILAIPIFIGSTLARAVTLNALIDIFKRLRAPTDSLLVVRYDLESLFVPLRKAILELPTELFPALKNQVLPRELVGGLRSHSIFTVARDESTDENNLSAQSGPDAAQRNMG